MATTKRSAVSIWVTWLTDLLAGDAQCWWAPWFKSHFRFDKVERAFDSAAWAAEHNDMIQQRVAALTADGWMVFLEDQNKYNVQGEVAEVSGKPDILAIRGEEARVIDCKSGKRKDGHYQQVLIYLLLLPLVNHAVKGKRLIGELQYKDGPPVEIFPEELTPDVKQRIVSAIREVGGDSPARRVPSFRECMFCDISKADCPDRIEKKAQATAAGLF